jgi:NADPH-dependent 2,4-dienoyl-CoA reductase/sulfur reductase-like enzyme
MPGYKYLIVGGGMTADAAVEGIRSADATGTIGVITNEQHPPYKRPPLSKGLWKGDPLESVWMKSAKGSATIHTSRTAARIDKSKKQVFDDRGEAYAFDKLLLATGGTVRKLPYEVDGIIYFRTIDDFERLKEETSKGSSAIVIGGGFIGSEVAAALTMNDVSVTMIFPEEGIGSRVYPTRLAQFLVDTYASKGVRVLANDGVKSITRNAGKFDVGTSGGLQLQAAVVVAGIGITPSVELAQSAGLETGNGIIVNEFLQTSHQDIYSAGDAANFFSPALDKRVRLEHEDNALTMGRHAGRNMAGTKEPYHHLAFFYSDLFEIGYEAVGEIDSRLQTVEEWKEEFKEGVIYYLDQGRIKGMLLWNTWGQVENARKLISGKQVFTKENVKGSLFALA